MNYEGARIIRKERIDDGSTGGAVVYYDQYGNQYAPTYYTEQNAPTGVTVYEVGDDGMLLG
jgi:hypothetical protein